MSAQDKKYSSMMVRAAIYLLCLYSFLLQSSIGHEKPSMPPSYDTQSFAQQYEMLADLLSNVRDEQSALLYIDDIQEQVDFLARNQSSGEIAYNMLSRQEQALFVKQFQNNRYHCGAVTQVMHERRRILLDPELASLLKELLMKIP